MTVSLQPLSQRQPLVVDAAIAVACTLLALGALVSGFEESVQGVNLEDVALVGVAGVALLWRRRFPSVVLIVTVFLRLTLIDFTGSELVLLPAAAVALYTVARYGSRLSAVIIAVVTAVGSTLIIITLDGSDPIAAELFAELAKVLLPVAFGDAARSRSEKFASLVAAETDAKVHAERLRIARDLHDIVAHALSAIAVQSGVAAYNLPSNDPEDPVNKALNQINEVGKKTLEDLRAMVGVLRSTDDVPTAPTPVDPNDVEHLERSARSLGIDLTMKIEGTFPPDVNDACVVAAHRICQEAITNVARHAGTVPATIRFTHKTDHSIVAITNSRSLHPEAVESSGVGIIGMRERAESIGGSLTAAPLVGGGFEVHAILPSQPQRS